jgi:Na+-transporting methylmalonyl-CoA/oxaloacetate decarboxylase gamma subunit
MTSLGRALAGAAFGALLTLLLHPVSRPFLLSATYRGQASEFQRSLDTTTNNPAPPEDLLGASLWVQLALERLNAQDAPLKQKEMQTVLKITQSAAARDVGNAYWHQARAAILLAAGHPLDARAAWIRASRGNRWDDYQANRLMRSREILATMTGTHQAWQIAYVFHHRSNAAPKAIERFARTLLGDATPTELNGLEIRYATLKNGELMRLGAKSVEGGAHGANIVELTAYPENMADQPSPRRLWTGQTEMLDRMYKLGGIWVAYSEDARKVFALNDGWRALLAPEGPDVLAQRMSLASIVTAGLTSTVGLLALVGLAMYGLGMAVERFWGRETALKWPYVAAMTLGLGAIGWWLTRDLFAGLCTALCAGFLGVTPPQVRRAKPEDLGPLFNTLIVTLSLLFSVTVVGYLLCTTPAAASLLPMLGIPSGYYNTPLLLGLSAVFLSLLLLAVPMWGLAQRLAIPHVLAVALRKFGASVGIGGLSLAILLTPLMVYADREVGQTLEKLLGNEYVYYYVQQ